MFIILKLLYVHVLCDIFDVFVPQTTQPKCAQQKVKGVVFFVVLSFYICFRPSLVLIYLWSDPTVPMSISVVS